MMKKLKHFLTIIHTLQLQSFLLQLQNSSYNFLRYKKIQWKQNGLIIKPTLTKNKIYNNNNNSKTSLIEARYKLSTKEHGKNIRLKQ